MKGMGMKKSVSLMYLLALCTVFITLSSKVAASTINVPGNYPTIGDALYYAKDGDTIRVAPGVYNESFSTPNHHRGIAIFGENKETTFITGVDPNSPYTVRIHGDGHRISGFTIQGSVLIDSVGSRVEDNVIEDGFINLSYYCMGVTVKDNLIETGVQITGSGNYIEDNICDMIVIKEEGGNYLTGNIVNTITLLNAPNNVLKENVITNDLSITGSSNSRMIQDIDESNLLNGVPYVYNLPYSTHSVPEDYPSIQAAIDAADLGDTIQVAPGTYYENINFHDSKSNLHLVGEDRETTIIDGNMNSHTIRVHTNDVEITGFTIRKGNQRGIQIDVPGYNCYIHNNIITDCISGITIQASGVKIRDNIITNNSNGISSHSSSQLTDNYVKNNLGTDILLKYEANSVVNNSIGDLEIHYSPNNVLRHNSLTAFRVLGSEGDYGHGLLDYLQDIDESNLIEGKSIYYLINIHDASIDSSSFSNTAYFALINSTNVHVAKMDIIDYNLLLAYCTNCSVSNLSFIDGSLSVDFSTDLNINNNQFLNTSSSNNVIYTSGLGLRFSDSNHLVENVVSDYYTAFYFLESANNEFVNNTIINNKFIIDHWNSGINIFYNNNFLENSQVYHEGRGPHNQLWDNGVDAGNYWSDYEGEDVDGDGIGDSPYIIDEANQDNYPLMSPIEFSNIPFEADEDAQPPVEEPSESTEEEGEETTSEETTQPTQETEEPEEPPETEPDRPVGIPGFPVLAILLGLILGLMIMRKR